MDTLIGSMTSLFSEVWADHLEDVRIVRINGRGRRVEEIRRRGREQRRGAAVQKRRLRLGGGQRRIGVGRQGGDSGREVEERLAGVQVGGDGKQARSFVLSLC